MSTSDSVAAERKHDSDPGCCALEFSAVVLLLQELNVTGISWQPGSCDRQGSSEADTVNPTDPVPTALLSPPQNAAAGLGCCSPAFLPRPSTGAQVSLWLFQNSPSFPFSLTQAFLLIKLVHI